MEDEKREEEGPVGMGRRETERETITGYSCRDPTVEMSKFRLYSVRARGLEFLSGS